MKFNIGDEVKFKDYTHSNEIIEAIDKEGKIQGRYIIDNELSCLFCRPEDYILIKRGNSWKGGRR